MNVCMKYKDYEWPYNPSKLQIKQEKDLVELKLPFVGTVLQNLNCGKKIISGTGELFGSDCFEQYAKLCDLYEDKEKGLLSIPELGTFLASFKKLNITCSCVPNSIVYYFEFWEDKEIQNNSEAMVANYHIVKPGETIFDIAKIYDKTAAELMKLNPWIKRPDEIKSGDRVLLL